MTATIHRLASTAGPSNGSRASAPGGEAREVAAAASSRSALSQQESIMRAAKDYLNHARIMAHEDADGDRVRQRELLRIQGETLLIAGLQILAESGER